MSSSDSNSSVVAVPPPPPPPMWTPEQLAAMPHNDLGKTVIGVLWFLVVLSALFVGLRVFCKRLTSKPLWWDDFILIAAWVCLTVDSAVWTLAVSYGYGKHTWDFPMQNFEHTLLLMYIAGTFAITGAIWSKTSFAVTLLRLTKGWLYWLVWFLLVTTNVFLGLSALFNWVQCTPVEKTWKVSAAGTCWSMSALVKYHIFSGVYSAVMDFTLALLPWKLIWALQMRKVEKLGIMVAMSMGIFAGIGALIKTGVLPTMESGDLQDGVAIVLWGGVEIAVTIIAASIPVLRILIREVKVSSRGGYHNTEGSNPATRPNRTTGTRGQSIVMTARGPGAKARQDSSSGNQSDESILSGKPGRDVA